MLHFLLWLALLLQSTSGDFASRSASHYADVLKLTCDSLPYRTVVHNSSCYFVINAETNTSTTSTSCSRVLPGAKLVGEAPDPVWTVVDFPENEFVRNGKTTGKKRAMCYYENRFPGSRNSTTTKANKCKRVNICGYEKPRLNYIFPLPYVSRLKETIEPGQTFVVRGHTVPTANHWSINFHADAAVFNPAYDIPFHFKVSYDINAVRLMTLVNRQWATDERLPLPNSLRHKDFEIRIIAHKDHFQIFINKEEFGTYKYRLPLASITHFSIWNWQTGNDVYNDLRPYYVHLGANYDPVPKESGIATTGFSYCKTLFVTGMVEPQFPVAGINLQQGIKDLGAQVLHPAFVLHWLMGLNTVTMNDYKGGQWGQATRALPLPFARGAHFNVTITNEQTGFVIYVNGKYHATFAHRVCPLDIDTLNFAHLADLTVTVSNAANCEVPKDNTGICANRG